MGQGDIPTSPRGGPRRRRQTKRQLQRLVAESERGVSPTAAKGHVRVIEGENAVKDSDPEGLEPDSPPESSVENRPAGFHVRAVPIDQPFSEA
jgi:hypothetical protein